MRDSLILLLDSGNPLSFPGQPTTNHFPGASTMASCTSYSAGNDGTFLTEFGTLGYKMVHRDTWNGMSKSITVPSTGVYTISAYYRYHGGTSSNNGATMYLSGYGGSDTNSGINKSIIGEWQRVSKTITVTDTTFRVYMISYGGVQGTDWSSWEVTMPQVEKLSYSTPFTDGTRSAIDGWKDLSGENNHGDLSAMSFDTNAQMLFNSGVGAYADTGFIPSFVHADATHSVWIKYSTFGGAVGCHNSRRFYMGLSSASNFGWGVCNVNNWSSGATHSIALEEYVMLTVVADNGVARSYINGKDTGVTFAYTKDSGFSPNESYKLGSWNGITQFVDGYIPISMMYNRALTASEVLQNFNAFRGRFGV